MMWYIGAVLAFLAGYLYHITRVEAIALAAAALAVSYLGEHLSASKRSEEYKQTAEHAQAKVAALLMEVEEAKKSKELLEQRIEELKKELLRLREKLPVDEEKREKIERIITETGAEL